MVCGLFVGINDGATCNVAEDFPGVEAGVAGIVEDGVLGSSVS
jgi:hypothetical protein